jgi:general secretion pathway protein D
VLGYTIVDGPAGLLKIVAVREALSNPIDFYTDKTPFTDRFITRLITLKNISASDMANVIKGLVSKEGNLFAYPVTNTLILTDSGTNIDRLMRLINELDQEGPQEVLEIIPIIYANAKDLAGKITQIFETDKGGAAPAAPTRPRGGAAAAAAAPDLDDAPRLKKVIPDDRTNSLIVLASKMAIQKVRALIRKLDSPLVGDEGEVHVYYLKYASAKDMATVLNAIAGTVAKDASKDKKPTGTTATAAAAAASAAAPLVGGAEFSGKFTVTADEGTNAIVITAGAKDYNTLVDQVISKLDIPRRQVYVEAVIVELAVTENQSLGVGILGGKNFNIGGNNLALFGSTFGFLDITRLLSGTVGAANTNQTIDVNLPNTGGTGTNTVSVPAFFSAIQFVQNNTNANILSTPNILTLDNQEAEIKIGRKVPFPSASATTIGGSLQTTFTREDVALSLKVKPQISEGGAIRMEVTQEDRDILPDQNAFSATAGPTTSERSIKTAVVATNGQTLVLGGLIRDRYTTRINKVPGLGDIPILGYLFKQRVKEKEKVNLLVFLTPYIIREPRDFLAILNRKIDEQNRFIEQNFSKGQQKQIRRQLETHADRLLKEGAGWTPEATPPTEEDRYPMELVPPPPAPGEETVPSGVKANGKKAETKPEAPVSETAATPPAAAAPVSPDEEEYSDLAIEPKYQKKTKKKTKATAPEQPPPAPPSESSAPSSPPPPGGDIDLAY